MEGMWVPLQHAIVPLGPIDVAIAVVASVCRWLGLAWAIVVATVPPLVSVSSGTSGWVSWLAGWAQFFFGSSVSSWIVRFFSLRAVPQTLWTLEQSFAPLAGEKETIAYVVVSNVLRVVIKAVDTFNTAFVDAAWAAVSLAFSAAAPPWMVTVVDAVSFVVTKGDAAVDSIFGAFRPYIVPAVLAALVLWQVPGAYAAWRGRVSVAEANWGWRVAAWAYEVLAVVGRIVLPVKVRMLFDVVVALVSPIMPAEVADSRKRVADATRVMLGRGDAALVALLDKQRDFISKCVADAVAHYRSSARDVAGNESDGTFTASELHAKSAGRFLSSTGVRVRLFLDGKPLCSNFQHVEFLRADLRSPKPAGFRFCVVSSAARGSVSDVVISALGMYLLTIEEIDGERRVLERGQVARRQLAEHFPSPVVPSSSRAAPATPSSRAASSAPRSRASSSAPAQAASSQPSAAPAASPAAAAPSASNGGAAPSESGEQGGEGRRRRQRGGRGRRSASKASNGAAAMLNGVRPPNGPGLPLYANNHCWAASIAVVLYNCVRALAGLPEDASEPVRNFGQRDWMRKNGPAWVAECAERVGVPSDAQWMMRRVLKRIPLTTAENSPMLSSLFFAGRAPAWGADASSALAALIFDRDRKHWCVATVRDGVWWQHDTESTRLGTTPPAADAYIWLRPRNGGAAREAEVHCECKKPVGEHGADKWRVTCSRCAKCFVGACARVPVSDRGLYAHGGWYCPTCLDATGPQRSLRQQQRRAQAAVPEAAAVPVPQPRSAQRQQQAAAPANQQQQQQQQQQPAPPRRVPMEQVAQLFRCSQASRPYLAALQGDALTNVVVYADPPVQINAGKTAAVRQRHRVALRQLKDALRSQRFWPMSLVEAIVARLSELAVERRWKATTHVRELANVAGAFSDLPLYTNSPVGWKLGESPFFAEAMKSLQLRANEESSAPQPAADASEVWRAVRLAPDVATKVALVMTWMCAGRVGDVLKLQRREVTLAPDFATSGAVKILFCRGKGARFSQPYTVPTRCAEQWRPLLQQYLAERQPTDWLFPGGPRSFGSLVSMALRTANPAYSVRALRRGALQAMSQAGVSSETLMLFSGHKRVDTLMRYLNWGAESEQRATAARAAAAHLDC